MSQNCGGVATVTLRGETCMLFAPHYASMTSRKNQKKNCGGERRMKEDIKGMTGCESKMKQVRNHIHSTGLTVTL